MPSRLPTRLTSHLVLPVIAAPMFLVSGPELVLASCKAGIIGSFPMPNARTLDVLETWLQQITTALAAARQAEPTSRIAPWAANMVVHRTYKRLQAELELAVKYQAPLVITALGGPAPVVEAIHSYGGLVFADVNSVAFAQKAARAGVDGLIIVSAGAGGHTGSISGFAFIEAVRAFWDGPLVLAGSIANGRAIRAAEVLGADLVYMGTRFIAARESMVSDDYRQMLIDATVEDVLPTNAITGVTANMLKPSLRRAGLDPDHLKPRDSVDFDDPLSQMKPWKDIWSAGQAVGAVRKVQPVAELVANLRREYAQVVAEERNSNLWIDALGVERLAGD
jgi:nitronate monooxygenase